MRIRLSIESRWFTLRLNEDSRWYQIIVGPFGALIYPGQGIWVRAVKGFGSHWVSNV